MTHLEVCRAYIYLARVRLLNVYLNVNFYTQSMFFSLSRAQI